MINRASFPVVAGTLGAMITLGVATTASAGGCTQGTASASGYPGVSGHSAPSAMTGRYVDGYDRGRLNHGYAPHEAYGYPSQTQAPYGFVKVLYRNPGQAPGYGGYGNDATGGMQKVAAHSAKRPQGDVVDVAVGAGDFTTLVAAVKAADLVETLKGSGPFTVFAPTDAAFAKIPTADLEALLADKEALVAVLTYHVVPGEVMAAEVVELDSAKTVQGDRLTIDTSDGVRVNGAQVVQADVMASNGVIHVIDTVLMP